MALIEVSALVKLSFTMLKQVIWESWGLGAPIRSLNSCYIAIFFLTWLYMAKIVSLWPKSVLKTISPTSLYHQFQGTIPQNLGPLGTQSEP